MVRPADRAPSIIRVLGTAVALPGEMCSRPRRIPTFSYRGRHRYLITACTRSRLPRFGMAMVVAVVHHGIAMTAADEGFVIRAYCYTPDHVHLLAEGMSDAADLRRFVKVAKQRAELAARGLGVYPLWQEGFHERVLRSWDSMDSTVRYILENPIRAGLVSAPDEYPFSGVSL